MPKGIAIKIYTPEFKKPVVETMREEKLSYCATKERFGISHKRVQDWEQIYLTEYVFRKALGLRERALYLIPAVHNIICNGLFHPSQISIVGPWNSVAMYNYQPSRLARSNIPKQNFSHDTNVVCNGSPSRMRMVRRISLGMTTRPRSSILRTIPVAFIFLSLLALRLHCYCLQELGNYAIFAACLFSSVFSLTSLALNLKSF